MTREEQISAILALYWEQLRQEEARALARLERLLAGTASQIGAIAGTTPGGLLGARYRQSVLAGSRGPLAQFNRGFKCLLDESASSAAVIAADREAALHSELLSSHHKLALGVGLSLLTHRHKSHEEIVALALLLLYGQRYRDGLTLDQRYENMASSALGHIDDVIKQATKPSPAGEAKKRVTAKAVGAQLPEALTASGKENLRYSATRLLRTEFAAAFRIAHVLSVTDENGRLRPGIRAVGWRLSPAHPRPCICDILASQDSGLGPGNYHPEDLPTSHPFCICFTVSVFVGDPEQFVVKEPRPDLVRPGEAAYYAKNAVVANVCISPGMTNSNASGNATIIAGQAGSIAASSGASAAPPIPPNPPAPPEPPSGAGGNGEGGEPEPNYRIPRSAAWERRVRQQRGWEVEEKAALRGMTVRQYDRAVAQRLRKLLGQMQPCMRIFENRFRSAIADGAFKNQFETGTSQGYIDANNVTRREGEKAFFGIAKSTPGPDRPKYGYLHSDVESDLENGVRLAQYGNIAITFKVSIIDRTSFTGGDSLDYTYAGADPDVSPRAVGQPSWVAVIEQFGDILDFPDADSLLDEAEQHRGGYFEAQYHGIVTLADVDRVTFAYSPPQDLTDMLDRLGIAWGMV